MADVSFQRAEFNAAEPEWDMVRTLCAGEAAVKAKGETLLPNPCVSGSTGESRTESAAVYARYKDRALFVNIVGRTRSSLVSAVFRKAPKLSLPTNLQYMAGDCDGAGVSIYQQSQAALSEVMATGRGGLLTDYPAVDGAASVADMRAGLIRANIVHYTASQIVNWQYSRVGGKSVLTRVVLCEQADDVNGFESKSVEQRRELAIENGRYVVRLWRKDDKGAWVQFGESVEPKQHSGAAWKVIPFTFIGALNNDANIDAAPMYDLACVNRKHYQLGADWYNALYFAGNPQPTMTGLTEAWRDWLQNQGVVLGSRAVLPLPVGGAYQLVTCPADSAIQKELADLVAQMIALGARLVQPGEVSKTATQAAGEQEVSHSVVSLAAENVSDAYVAALKFAQLFMGGAGECEYRLNGDIAGYAIDAQMLAAVVAAVQGGMVPKSDAVAFLQRAGLIDSEKTLEQVDEETATGGLNLGG